MNNGAHRRGLLAKIHIGKKALAMDDASYRAMLEHLTGHDSAGRCSVPQLERVLSHMESKGFNPQPATKGRKLADDRQSKMIRGIWLELHKMGAVRNPSERALAAYIKRQTGVERLEWLTVVQASDVIEALKKWRDRL